MKFTQKLDFVGTNIRTYTCSSFFCSFFLRIGVHNISPVFLPHICGGRKLGEMLCTPIRIPVSSLNSNTCNNVCDFDHKTNTETPHTMTSTCPSRFLSVFTCVCVCVCVCVCFRGASEYQVCRNCHIDQYGHETDKSMGSLYSFKSTDNRDIDPYFICDAKRDRHHCIGM